MFCLNSASGLPERRGMCRGIGRETMYGLFYAVVRVQQWRNTNAYVRYVHGYVERVERVFHF